MLLRNLTTAILALALTSQALAAADDLPPLGALTKPAAGAPAKPAAVPSSDELPQLGSAPPPPPPAAAVGDDARAELIKLDTMTNEVRRKIGVAGAAAVVPPPPVITVRPGMTEIIPISVTQLNRIRAPFASPAVKSTSKASIEVEPNGIYVSTATTQMITLYVFDQDNPDTSITLLLKPADITPVDVELRLPGQSETAAAASAVRPQKAEKWEREQPYVDTVKTLFKDLALGEVPPGYGLSEIRGASHPLMPNCWFDNLKVAPAQILEGGSIIVLVAKVENRSGSPQEIDESACAAPGVVAVAAWPSVRLEPGEATELYIARHRPTPAERSTSRPSVIGRRNP